MSPGAKLDQEAFNDKAGETPAADWPHADLWNRVKEALFLLPNHFEFATELHGIDAADIASANTLLGSGIEDHIPKALNRLKAIWDPQGEYPDYFFARQPQVFPDVPLRSNRPNAEEPVLFAIEVKSWYVLAREGEPSARVYVNPDWCHPADLLVVYPWALDAAIAGRAQLFSPFVVSMRKAARLKNDYWKKRAANEEDGKITPPTGTPHFHPKKGENFNDVAVHDSSGNFGRVTRTGVMDEWIARLEVDARIAGIPLVSWRDFLSSYDTEPKLKGALRRIRAMRKASEGEETTIPKELAAIIDSLAKYTEQLAGGEDDEPKVAQAKKSKKKK